jgi:hypothetical protein
LNANIVKSGGKQNPGCNWLFCLPYREEFICLIYYELIACTRCDLSESFNFSLFLGILDLFLLVLPNKW